MSNMANAKQRSQRRRYTRGTDNGASRQRQNGSSGNARRNYDRYVALAREAALAGDTIEMENCYQHAEHYFRVMRESGQ